MQSPILLLLNGMQKQSEFRQWIAIRTLLTTVCKIHKQSFNVFCLFYAGSSTGLVQIVNISSGLIVKEYSVHTGTVRSVSQSICALILQPIHSPFISPSIHSFMSKKYLAIYILISINESRFINWSTLKCLNLKGLFF